MRPEWDCMKTINSRKVVMLLGGILAATLAAGCFGGGPGYSNDPYGYNSSFSSYGNSHPYSGYANGYSYPQSYRNSYGTGYQNGVRADENRDRGEAHRETQHSSVDREKHSSGDSERVYRSEKN